MGKNDLNDETVIKDSKLGKHLNKVQKVQSMGLLFKGKVVPLTKRITVGRDKNNDIELSDKMVSRNHAVIQKIKDDFFVVDLSSTNGTFINGKQLEGDKYYKVSAGDSIRFGKTELKIN